MKIAPIDINRAGITALIQNLARDCSPSQFLREFVANSIDACHKVPEGHCKQIIVSKMFVAMDEDESIAPVEKLCFLDSGVGMTLDEMTKLLNNLSASSKTTGPYQKYGVGAKISALTRNHVGIEYRSWQFNTAGQLVGHSITLGYDSTNQSYGIIDKDDYFYEKLDENDRLEIEKKYMPDGHGTLVILHGMTFDEITSNKPKNLQLLGSNSNENWLINYFYQRFFKAFDDIEFLILVNQAEASDPKHSTQDDKAQEDELVTLGVGKKWYHHRFIGQYQKLTSRSEAYGEMNVGNEKNQSEATLYWWLIKEKTNDRGRSFLKGHTAIICENEIFDLEDSRSNKLSGFGVYMGKSRVVIYIEPKKNIVQNLTRTSVQQADGNPITDWETWQNDFKAKMPVEISDFLKNQMEAVKIDTKDSNLTAQLEPYKDLYHVKKLAKSYAQQSVIENKNGKQSVVSFEEESKANNDCAISTSFDATSTTNGTTDGKAAGQRGNTNGTPYPSGQTQTKGAQNHQGQHGGTLENQSEIVQESDIRKTPSVQGRADIIRHGQKRKTIQTLDRGFPKVLEMTLEMKESNPLLKDCAAEYDNNNRILFVNKEFVAFTDTILYFKQKYPDMPDEIYEVMINEIYNLFIMALLETVVSIESMPSSAIRIAQTLSPDVLTAAVMSRHLIVSHVNRTIAGRYKLKSS